MLYLKDRGVGSCQNLFFFFSSGFLCSQGGWIGTVIDPLELGGRDWVSYLLILLIFYHLDLKFTLALYSKALSSLKKRGRDFEFDINVLN